MKFWLILHTSEYQTDIVTIQYPVATFPFSFYLALSLFIRNQDVRSWVRLKFYKSYLMSTLAVLQKYPLYTFSNAVGST